MLYRHLLKLSVCAYILLFLFIGNCFVWYVVAAEGRGGLLTIAFLDVGQGDSIFIESPTGNQMLIDAGRNSGVLRELGRIMPFYDRSIDVVLATHPDSDHIGGFPYVFDMYDVGVMLDSGAESDSAITKELEYSKKEKYIDTILARRGMNIDLGGGVFVEILFPIDSVAGFKTNNASIVARLVFKDFSVILTGDSPSEIEKQLVVSVPDSLRGTLLKVGHHGSRTSSSPEFVSAVSPEYAIISAGKDNSYGHPHAEVTDLLDSLGISTIKTYDVGTIVFVSDGDNFVLK